jgi:DNA polymerase I-like protein with 3'-5' exonuclease and polymerase domains
MQNFSVRHPEWGKKVRSVFTPPPGYSMLIGDLSQIELAILAYYLELLCDDSSMAEGFRAGIDAHDNNTINWYGLQPGDPEFKQQRAKAKNGAFATNYGARAKRLSLTLSITLSEAMEILNTVNSNLKVGELKAKLWNLMLNDRSIKPIPHRRKGYTHGVFYDCFDTRLFYPEIKNNERYLRTSEERKSFNALCQSGCFSVLAKLLNESLPHIQMYNGWLAAIVHDEALGYVKTVHAEALQLELNRIFNSIVLPTEKGGVPVRADFHIVNSWADK